MDAVSSSKAKYYIDQLAVTSEPGLTNAQLLLTNHDLRPGEKQPNFCILVESVVLTMRLMGSGTRTAQMGSMEFRSLLDCRFREYCTFIISLIESPQEIFVMTVNLECLLTILCQNTWMISSSMIVSGLSWWQSWICVWIGYFISSSFVCATGRIGAKYHISFPVASRASFGIWGSLWPVFNRAAMAVSLIFSLSHPNSQLSRLTRVLVHLVRCASMDRRCVLSHP